jgi:hypothetical protein
MLLIHIAAIGWLLFLATGAVAQDVPLAGTIASLRGDLYRVQVGSEVTLFLVAPGGIILVDPLQREAARWLRGELEERFPGRPVRYVIHTSHRWERAEGASVLTQTAEVVAHEEYEDALSDARRRLSPPWSDLDRNSNNVLEFSELVNEPRAEAVRARDRDRDGAVTPDELYAGVSSAEMRYDSSRTLAIGDRRVDIVYPSPAYGAGATAVLFPAERVVFVDRIPDMRDPFTGASRPRDVAAWARTIATLDADVVVNTRGETIPHADVVLLSRYLSDLFREVLAAYESGSSAAEVRATAALEMYKGTAVDALRAQHIAVMYRALRVYRINVHGAGTLNAFASAGTYCASYDGCERPRAAASALIGMSISRGRLAGVAEMALAQQLLASRTSPTYDDAFAHRETITSVLGGYASPPGRRLSFAALGGISYVVSDAQGLALFKPGFSGIGDRRVLGRRQTVIGLTAGVDVVILLGQRAAMAMPVRVIYAQADNNPFWPGPAFVQAGIGLRYRLFRRAE